MDYNNKDFKGIWVPKELLKLKLDYTDKKGVKKKKRISGNEREILAMIINLGSKEEGFFASNKYISETLGLGINRVQDIITLLFENRLISKEIDQTKISKKRILRPLIEIESALPIEKENEVSNLDNGESYHGKQGQPITGNRDRLSQETGIGYHGKQGQPITENRDVDRKGDTKLETKDERESLSHFQFFKKTFPNECMNWRKEYEKKIFNHVDFLKGFNNKMTLQKFPKNEMIVTRIDEFARQWLRNQKESEKPAPRLPKLGSSKKIN